MGWLSGWRRRCGSVVTHGAWEGWRKGGGAADKVVGGELGTRRSWTGGSKEAKGRFTTMACGREGGGDLQWTDKGRRRGEALLSHQEGKLSESLMGTHDRLRPDLGWMKKLQQILGRKHQRNLHAIYVLHPTLGLRATILALQMFVDGEFHPSIFRSIAMFVWPGGMGAGRLDPTMIRRQSRVERCFATQNAPSEHSFGPQLELPCFVVAVQNGLPGRYAAVLDSL
ncbi:hypothetical protein KSP40_PGU007882 [Platanthera guangdongensis]|uniref:CRAL-TRIO domain-containing protein n=1 Tax=Platanthera guangdongensis TaxID=2320717 RepID=A0ABR2MYD5_9ASPA